MAQPPRKNLPVSLLCDRGKPRRPPVSEFDKQTLSCTAVHGINQSINRLLAVISRRRGHLTAAGHVTGDVTGE